MSNEEKKNPFQTLVDFYEGSVKEQDEKGFADIYKRETERFFIKLDAHLKEFYQLSFTPEDVEYGDGYFLFGHGTNSVIHFHLKEAPGWLFGIWWSPKKFIPIKEGEPERYEDDRINCQFFAQYEEIIDKFKPTASMFEGEFDWMFETPDENLWRLCYNACKVIQLILQYPYVAFVRDLHWQNLNEEYVTPEEAEEIYHKWRNHETQVKLMKQENKKTMLDCLKYIFQPLIDKGDAFIADRGDGWSPRYELVLRNVWRDRGQEDSEDGHYDLFEFGVDESEWPDKAEDKALWDKTVEECKARAKELDDYWFNPVSDCLCILSGEKYWEYKKENEEKED